MQTQITIANNNEIAMITCVTTSSERCSIQYFAYSIITTVAIILPINIVLAHSLIFSAANFFRRIILDNVSKSYTELNSSKAFLFHFRYPVIVYVNAYIISNKNNLHPLNSHILNHLRTKNNCCWLNCQERKSLPD